MYARVLERTEQDGGTGARLSTEDTFALYKALMGLADTDQTASRERLHIERLLDEQRSLLLLVDDRGDGTPSRSVPRRAPAPPPPPRPSRNVVQPSSDSHSVPPQRSSDLMY